MFKLFEFDEEESNEWGSFHFSPSSSAASSSNCSRSHLNGVQPHSNLTAQLFGLSIESPTKSTEDCDPSNLSLLSYEPALSPLLNLSEDVWVEIFSFFSTREKLQDLVFVGKIFHSSLYKSIHSLKLLGIDTYKQQPTQNTTLPSQNQHKKPSLSTSVSSSASSLSSNSGHDDDDNWLMMGRSNASTEGFLDSRGDDEDNSSSSYTPIQPITMRRINTTRLYSSSLTRRNLTSKPASTQPTTDTSTKNQVKSLNDLYELDQKPLSNPIVDILNPFAKLSHLSIEFCKVLDGNALTSILQQFSHLETLNIVHCFELKFIHITYPMLACKKLKTLQIKDCRNIDEYAGGLKVDCHSLTHLEISSTPCVSNRLITDIMERNSNTLQSLNLFGINSLFELSIGKKMSVLTNLTIKRCKNFSKFHVPIKQVCLVFPQLLDMDLSLTSVSDQAMKILTTEQRLQSLKILRLEGCKMLKNPTFGTCPNLETVILDSSSDLEGINFPPNSCPALNTLSVNYTKINDKALEKIFNVTKGMSVEEYEISGYVPPIRKLSAKKCKSLHNPKITSYHLEELDLHGCYNCHAPTVVDLSKNNMKKLNLNWTKISDDDLKKIVTQCPSLTELSLHTCDNLVNPTIESNTLQKISFTGAHFLQSPVFKCEQLQHVDFNNCEKLESPTIVKKKVSTSHYNVRRRLDFEVYADHAPSHAHEAFMQDVAHVSPIKNMCESHQECPSPSVLHPKMKVVEEEPSDNLISSM